MDRKLFCEINTMTYKISVGINKTKRFFNQLSDKKRYCNQRQKRNLPVLICSHNSLIRRTLGEVDFELQNNKAVNLNLAVPRVDGILILPGETFSFWRLVGVCSKSKGYKKGLVIKGGKVSAGVGGGMCQFTNLLHWMILHSPLDIIEHHHHNKIDMFPDFERQIPFGTGTSIMHNYLDYQFTNNTKNTFQLRVQTSDTHLIGELRALFQLDVSYHVVEENKYFEKIGDTYFRNSEIYRRIVDKVTGNEINRKLIIKNHAMVLYDSKYI